MTRDLAASLDSKVNGIYGICVPIWGALFIISWQRKQKGLQFVWNVSDTSHSVQDERDNDFRYFNSFNQFTDHVEKIQRAPNKAKGRVRKLFTYMFILLVIAA